MTLTPNVERLEMELYNSRISILIYHCYTTVYVFKSIIEKQTFVSTIRV